MKLGIKLSIDVTKLDETAFVKGKKGTYADLTVFLNPDTTDQYGNHGGIKQQQGDNEIFVGNAKVFWRDDNGQSGARQKPSPKPAPTGGDPLDQDIPF